MRVLMFGWEFPPYKSGGLGTACYGMSRALAKKGTEILFVLPQTPSDAPVRVGERLSLCSASGTRVERTARNLRINEEVRELWREKLHIEHVDSLLLPYDTPESYDERRRELERLQSVKRNADGFSSTQETILRRTAATAGSHERGLSLRLRGGGLAGRRVSTSSMSTTG